MRIQTSLILLLLLVLAPGLRAAEPPSRPGIDAPELAPLGKFAVGVRTLTLLHTAQPDVLALDAASGKAPLRDRPLTVDIWYPAEATPGAVATPYRASLPAEPPRPPVEFEVPALALRDAKHTGGGYPLVVVSHGYSNVTAALSWLTENLASKGYVVAAIRHEDPPLTDRSGFPQLLLRRPLDIAFVTAQLQGSLAAEGLVDPAHTALVGYSMGGYGVLTAAGATLDPAGLVAKLVPDGLMLPYARDGASREAVQVKGLRAVVAMSPAGNAPLAAWGNDGLAAISAPLLLISGDADRTVDYSTGARAIFAAATGARRYLLTFRGAGHAIGLGPAPQAMRSRLWDFDWFEDPVWRKERIVAINQHMITAFLDLYVKGEQGRAAYLDGLVPDSNAGQWAQAPADYDAYSPGGGEITAWKGFQRNHAMGLELLRAEPVALAR